MKKYIRFTLLIFTILTFNAFSQNSELNKVLNWKGLVKEIGETGNVNEYLSFQGAFTDAATNLPLYSYYFEIQNKKSTISAEFVEQTFEPCTSDESGYLTSLEFTEQEITIRTSVTVGRNVPKGVVSFIPLRKNPETGVYEKLVEFKMTFTVNIIADFIRSANRIYSENSVLSEGDWIKIRVDQSGIYKITYSDLQEYGLDPSSINPSNIRIYGNAHGMLPENNGTFRYDDLQENAIWISGQEDGIFNQQDYIIFYGMSPHIWSNSLGFFTRQVSLYDDYNYYYISSSQGVGKRLLTEPSVSSTPTHTVTTYIDYKAIEDETYNLTLSGKAWYGDLFGEIQIREYNFNFPNIKTDESITLKTEIANRTITNEAMAVSINEVVFDTVTLTSIIPSSTKFAQKKKKTIVFNSAGPQINVKMNYLPSTPTSAAWLDYIMINAICSLNFDEGQLLFRDLNSVEVGAISQFEISSANSNVQVWEVTDPILPKIVDSDYSGNVISFTLETDSLREFIAFDGSQFLTPEFAGTVDNQNLHSDNSLDMVIVAHPLFLEDAYQLAAIHEVKDGFSTKVVTPEEIYNEFSSGKQDPTAIRDYIKMLYDKSEGQNPRFLVLFGDGSFDPKDRVENNTNFIPTFQTQESLITSSSYVIDDYFGCMDEDEGVDGTGELDIGIGRIPVKTREEAQIVLKKIVDYITPGTPSFGTWRTNICLIADDEDGNLHLDQADSLANGVEFIPKHYNQKKIYLDAYTQIKTPSGYRYPEVTSDLNQTVNEGALIINYVGHGGKAGWAHERILQANDMLNWKNLTELPVFITATCEFSRFDEPELETGGEMVLLNPAGGGIALFTTTRLAYAQSNFTLNQRVYNTAFTLVDGEYPYMGDIIRRSKPPGQPTTRNFVLLGDPALKLAYPEYQVRTLEIKNQVSALQTDTLRALDVIEIKGDIADLNGNTVETFNGTVNIKVFDKKTRYKTNGNDQYSYPVEFFCQDRILWEGNATVTNGVFDFTFLLTKDIAYNFGSGKFSYYAWSNESDAIGYKGDIVIGGVNENAVADVAGPVVELYLNDLSFVSGDLTHSNPVMLAFLSDPSGINMSAGGIGHETTAVLDDDHSSIFSLKDYYIQDMDDYRSGSINYPFYNLPDGEHTLTVKTWDNYNNSSSTTISFVINSHGPLKIDQVINYPNPFIEFTTFTFNHTRPGDKLKINLEIFDLNGKIVQMYENTIESEIINSPFLIWYGDDLKGNKLKSGVYLYTLQVTDEDGNTSIQKQKLILMN